MKTKTRDITVRCSLTKHTCGMCSHIFYIRASFFECPKCGIDSMTPVIVADCYDVSWFLNVEMDKRKGKFGLTSEMLNDCLISFPGYTFDMLKVIYEDFC